MRAFKKIIPLSLLFLSIFSLLFFTQTVTAAEKEKVDEHYLCTCNFVLTGLDSSGDFCRLGGNMVDIDIGDGTGEAMFTDVLDNLYDESYGAKTFAGRCYPAPLNTLSARKAMSDKASAGPPIQIIVTKDNCGNLSGGSSYKNFSAEGHAGIYGIAFEGCSARTIQPTQTPNEGVPIEAMSRQVAELNRLQGGTVQGFLGLAIKTATGIMGTIALAMIIYGGLLWMTSNGNGSRVEKAQSVIIWAALGLLVIFASYAIITFIFEAASPTLTDGR